MKKYTQTVAQLLTAAALSLPLPLMAQAGADHSKMGMDHSKMGMPATPGMTDGEIRKIDRDAGKITIKHGEIKHLDMPPMSMVFNVKDKALLDKATVGAKIQFMVSSENGRMTVTDIQPAK
ncbi:MAG: copper-binding protein [Rhodocyclaceae bacterium]|jgi:Cu/Ag efflux protein CusF|nr:copper-binding protein [Rhodocyclaceae bacterium]